ncbi:helix-turn-helix transcriptional regulator [Streptococcus suis]|nr:helix-turn-helix transcriptional regulator [Streptococcus suis]HEM5157610.1 helix-turn-helix transcriptional regulator [Streptococcus suis]
MDVGARIKQRRQQIEMSADELANKTGVSRATIYRYEKGDIEKVGPEVLKEIAAALRTSPSFLMGWDDKVSESTEIQSIFSNLNSQNKKKVIDFATILLDKQNRKPIQMTTVYITGFVSAGNGVIQDDYVDAEITIPTNEVPDDFDSVAKVIGESMAPKIQDGDLLFIKNTPQIDYNDLAVFQVNGENFVKQLKNNGKPYLKSLNPDYDDVILSEDDDIRTIGEVVGIYRED